MMSLTTPMEMLTPSPINLNFDNLTTNTDLNMNIILNASFPHNITNVLTDDSFQDRDPAIDFEVLRIRDLEYRNFPGSLSIASWNCCGLKHKYHSIHNIFRLTGVDILVLNETFRLPGVPWPRSLPPCLAEATNSGSSSTRLANGVAVLVNPQSLGINENIRNFSILNIDNVHGLKVVMKINNLTLMAVYAPSSAGNELLTGFLSEATQLSSNQSPVVICGDLNITPINSVPTIPDRVRHFYQQLGANFFRADTGEDAKRPTNRVNAVNLDGNILDHFFGAHVSFDLSRGLNTFYHDPRVTNAAPD